MRRGYEKALITGASSGIGAAFARILPESTNLLLTGRSEERLRRVASGLAGRSGHVELIAADLATVEGRAAVIEQARASEIDLLICSAGLGRAGSFIDRPIAEARDTLTVNVLATVELLHALMPEMIARARRGGRRKGVIIVSSAAVFAEVGPGLACYGASKAFMLRFAQVLAAEVEGQPIDLLALCPTYTDTAFFNRAGLAPPPHTMSAEAVAREGMAALGRRTIHFCSIHHYPQAIRRLVAFNPALAAWRWPRQIAARLQALRPRRNAGPTLPELR